MSWEAHNIGWVYESLKVAKKWKLEIGNGQNGAVILSTQEREGEVFFSEMILLINWKISDNQCRLIILLLRKIVSTVWGE